MPRSRAFVLLPAFAFKTFTKTALHKPAALPRLFGTNGPTAEPCRQLLLWESANAITLCTNDMRASCDFYEKLGLDCSFGGPDAPFTTMAPSDDGSERHAVYVNLERDDMWEGQRWGRVVFHVSDVDAMYERAIFEPKDAPWGERYFHIVDPAGHELSFARRIEGHPRWERGR